MTSKRTAPQAQPPVSRVKRASRGLAAAPAHHVRSPLADRSRRPMMSARPTARSAPPPRSPRRWPRTARSSARRRTRVSRAAPRPDAARRGEGEEDLAAAVVGDRAGPREPEPGAPRKPLRAARACSGASVATTAMQLPPGDRAALPRQRAADRHAVDAQVRRRAEVREHEHADRAPASGTTRLEVPIPPFQPKQTIPVPAPTAPSATGAAVRGRDARGPRRPRRPARRAVVEPAVVALADDRDHDVLDPDAGVRGHRRRDRPS